MHPQDQFILSPDEHSLLFGLIAVMSVTEVAPDVAFAVVNNFLAYRQFTESETRNQEHYAHTRKTAQGLTGEDVLRLMVSNIYGLSQVTDSDLSQARAMIDNAFFTPEEISEEN